MSTFSSTTFGKISGRHGTAVAMKSKDGRNFLRLYTAPHNPKSPKQIAHRAKFAFVNKEFACMKELFKITFGHSRGKSEAVSLAFNSAIEGEYPDYTINYSQLKFTIGSVNDAAFTDAQKLQDTKVKIDWDENFEGSESNENDAVNIILFNSARKIAILHQIIAKRADGSTQIELPATWAGAEVHIWLYFTNPTATENSNSQFIKQLVL